MEVAFSQNSSDMILVWTRLSHLWNQWLK